MVWHSKNHMTAVFTTPPPPISSDMASELFHVTYLSTPNPEPPPPDTTISLTALLDRFLGFMRIPYLVIEARRVYRVIQEGESLWESTELRYQSLSVVANIAEICLWFHRRKLTKLTPLMLPVLTGVHHLARMILYEYAVIQESAALYRYNKLDEAHPHLEIKKMREYLYIRTQFISHMAYLTWTSLGLIHYIKGVPYPKTFLRVLQFTSFLFGLLSMQYEEKPLISPIVQKFLPNPNIYDR